MRRTMVALPIVLGLTGCALHRAEPPPPAPPYADSPDEPAAPPPPPQPPPPPSHSGGRYPLVSAGLVGVGLPVRPASVRQRRSPRSAMAPPGGRDASQQGDTRDGSPASDSIDGGAPYCATAGRSMPVAQCRLYGDPNRISALGHATLAAPSSMYRGQTATVRFAVVAGGQERADALAVGEEDDAIARGPARFGVRMSAQLSGEGFVIAPAGSVSVDAGATGEAVWEWRVTSVRGPRHYLRVDAWVMRRTESGSWIRGVPLHYPSYQIAVPIRWIPEWMHDVLTDSLEWFSLGTNWAKALAALVVAMTALWLAIRTFGRKA